MSVPKKQDMNNTSCVQVTIEALRRETSCGKKDTKFWIFLMQTWVHQISRAHSSWGEFQLSCITAIFIRNYVKSRFYDLCMIFFQYWCWLVQSGYSLAKKKKNLAFFQKKKILPVNLPVSVKSCTKIRLSPKHIFNTLMLISTFVHPMFRHAPDG